MAEQTEIVPPHARPELVEHRGRMRDFMIAVAKCKSVEEAAQYVRAMVAEREAGQRLWNRFQREAADEGVKLREAARKRALKALRTLEAASADLEQVARSGVLGPRIADHVAQLRRALEKK